MFNKQFFAGMRRAGMGIGVSKAKLSEAMVDILVQLPEGTTKLKETVVENLGILGQMSATRDVNEAWNQAKKNAAREFPDRFILDSRNAVQWNDGSVRVLDKKISTANFKKLNDLAEKEGCNVNTLISRLIKSYGKTKAG